MIVRLKLVFSFQNISGKRATDQNIPGGTVVDTKIVSPVINEFYLNAHSAFQVNYEAYLYLCFFSFLFSSSTKMLFSYRGLLKPQVLTCRR